MKHARFPRSLTAFGLGAVLAAAVAVVPAGERAAAQAPPPPPPFPNATPSSLNSPPAATPLPSTAPLPSSSPSPRGRRRRGRPASPATRASNNPEPTATPTSPAFATLDGTWEVQLQHTDRTDYSYFVIKQSGTSALSGVWRVDNKQYPFEGTYDGRLIRMVVKEPERSVTLSGYVEGASDMVGLVDSGTPNVDGTPFTAEHRGARGNAFNESETKKR